MRAPSALYSTSTRVCYVGERANFHWVKRNANAGRIKDPMNSGRVLIFDLETTGLNVDTDRVVQLGIAIFRDGALTSSQTTLVNPCTPIPAVASRIHNITDDQVAESETFGVVGEEFARLLKTSAATTVLCGYNASGYDVPLLNSEFERHCIPTQINGARVLDPLLFLRYHRREWPSRTLSSVAERLGHTFKAHDAMEDAIATGFVLFRLIEQGIIPEAIEDAFRAQEAIVEKLNDEAALYGRFLYRDRANDERVLIGFGKHCGHELNEVPLSYLKWVLGLPDVPPAARVAIQDVTNPLKA